jgi:hypothetical protein
MRVLHALMGQPNIIMSMIHWILVACEYHMKQLKENGDTLQSENPLNLDS